MFDVTTSVKFIYVCACLCTRGKNEFLNHIGLDHHFPLFSDIPKPPSNIIPSRNTDTSVVVTWEESKDAKELVGYYIESSIVGSGKWEPCNNNPVKGTR